jgi:hypothetical protein
MNRVVRIVAVGLIFVASSVGLLLLFRHGGKITPSPVITITNEQFVHQAVSGFGGCLKSVELDAPEQDIITAMGRGMKRLITDRLYREFVQDPSKIPGRTESSPWPESIQIDSMQKLDNASYLVNGKITLMNSDALTQGGNAGEAPVTLTLVEVSGTWLIDAVQ